MIKERAIAAVQAALLAGAIDAGPCRGLAAVPGHPPGRPARGR